LKRHRGWSFKGLKESLNVDARYSRHHTHRYMPHHQLVQLVQEYPSLVTSLHKPHLASRRTATFGTSYYWPMVGREEERAAPYRAAEFPWQRLRLRNGSGSTGSSAKLSSSLGLRLFALGNTHSSSNSPSINARITRHASWVAGLTWLRSPQPADVLIIHHLCLSGASTGRA
jgi:hypothetical protein